MAHRFINELKPGEQLSEQVFLVQSKDLRTTTQGSLYIHFVLMDRTGQVPGRMWQANEQIYNAVREGGFLRVRGRSENYKGSLQFIVEALAPVPVDEVELSDFLPQSKRDAGEMWERTKEILRTIEDRDLLLLIKTFIDDADLVAAYRRAPAAVQMHHAYLGGLMEHTLNVLELGLLVASRYPRVDRDLLLAGIFLHDIGKTSELTHESHFSYSDRGQLVGHIAIATIWIEQKAALVASETGQPFPDELKNRLQHIVLSHHGRYEFGSPRLPATPEAMLIHLLDNIDAKLEQYFCAIDSDSDENSRWTQFIRALDSKIYKPSGDRSGDSG